MTNDVKTQPNGPVLLCILDGWGHSDKVIDNAIAQGQTPNWDHMLETRPKSLLGTSGLDVGLPDGQMGNSEVGHMTIGSGRVVLQDLPRINEEIETGTLAANPELLDLIVKLRATGGICHLAGLLSPGGVHSHQDHMAAVAQILDNADIPVRIHGFMDGRDTPPTSGADFVAQITSDISGLKNTSIATLCGRYFAMDRDTNWDRIQIAYEALFSGKGTSFSDPVTAVRAAYDKEETDEFIKPLVQKDFTGIQDGDGIICANFRADRARELLSAIVEPDFDGFDRGHRPQLASIKGMVEYSAALAGFIPALFPPVQVNNTLGEIVSRAGRTQLRIAETEKYAHVTFFLNGGEERVYSGEERILVPSPKVATYDLKPEMSAPEVEDKLIAAIQSGSFDLIVVNFANPDMVGHTGVMPAAIKAVETIDGCIGRLRDAVADASGTMLITADHGNIELMRDPETEKPHTAHTTNLVPFVLAAGSGITQLNNGTLADIAPTLLHFLNITAPAEMTGHNLAIGAEGNDYKRAAS
ncbi:2,3-bisphosphoglycerate-independent phosphoglycerate mutase [Sneathiella marina]|uniref:2,3-bisphosphoglycerate-independent phosphoglycerate mutase n=1 Tax=Sneathiella marina TaxID=2950108 RepID=A0ABY4W3C3_9PROT|nr:2,3-bisphosphoglycerate-independent phosphoglycerate mutase [Sneathiella marina]USG61693.1 2,3-bisphosphoglycerate-independent phosphoglycerate mutase [Sneathiella marina]